MKVVLDSNVVIAAFATQGLCGSVLELCLDRHQIILSKALLREIRKALRDRIKLPAQEVKGITAFLRRSTQIKSPEPLQTDVCRDPEDVKVLSLAVTAGAETIVTGDKDLLTLGKFQTIPIVSPREFWEQRVIEQGLKEFREGKGTNWRKVRRR